MLAQVKTPEDLKAQIASLEGAIKELSTKLEKSTVDHADMVTALESMTSAQAKMTTLLSQMQALHDAIPGAFDTAVSNYLNEIESQSNLIQSTYQSTLNTGYQSMFLGVTAAAFGAIIALFFYRKPKGTESSS